MIAIPKGAWMKYRKQGRNLFGRKPGGKDSSSNIITWSTTPPPKGATVYKVGWHLSQHPFMATETFEQP